MTDATKHDWRPVHSSSSVDVKDGVPSLEVVFKGSSVFSILVHVQQIYTHSRIGVVHQDMQGTLPSALIVLAWASGRFVNALLLMDEDLFVWFLDAASPFTVQTWNRFCVVKPGLENIFQYEISVVNVWASALLLSRLVRAVTTQT